MQGIMAGTPGGGQISGRQGTDEEGPLKRLSSLPLQKHQSQMNVCNTGVLPLWNWLCILRTQRSSSIFMIILRCSEMQGISSMNCSSNFQMPSYVCVHMKCYVAIKMVLMVLPAAAHILKRY